MLVANKHFSPHVGVESSKRRWRWPKWATLVLQVTCLTEGQTNLKPSYFGGFAKGTAPKGQCVVAVGYIEGLNTAWGVSYQVFRHLGEPGRFSSGPASRIFPSCG